MRENKITTDNISSFKNINVLLDGKPRKILGRVFPESDECIFCIYKLNLEQNSDKILAKNNGAFVIKNKWGIFNDDAEVIIADKHVNIINKLNYEDNFNFLSMLFERYQINKNIYKNVLIFINIGIFSGGSIEHLHGQVVGVNENLSDIGSSFYNIDKIMQDISTSYNERLVLSSENGSIIYIPVAGIVGGEIRILSDDISSLVVSLVSLLNSIDSNYNYSYNLVFHFIDGKYFAQYLPRHEIGIIYPMYLNTSINHYNNREYFNNLVHNLLK